MVVRCEQEGRSVRAELVLTTHFTAFLILWLTSHFHEALTYIRLCTQSINDLNHSPSLFSDKTRLNLVGLIAMSLSASLFTSHSPPTPCFDIIHECISQFNQFDVEVKLLMGQLIQKMQEWEEKTEEKGEFLGDLRGEIRTPKDEIPKLCREMSGKVREKQDILVTKEFEMLFFITAFMSHIDPSTPLISEKELESAANRHFSVFSSEKPSELPSVNKYYRLFKRISGHKSPFRVNYEASRQHETLPDWEQGRNRGDNIHHRTDSEHYSDVASERRDRSVPSRNKVVYFSPMLGQGKAAQNVSVLRDLERSKRSLLRARNNLDAMQQEAESRLRTKRNIMVEFAPRSATNDVQISLQPLPSRLGRLPRLPELL